MLRRNYVRQGYISRRRSMCFGGKRERLRRHGCDLGVLRIAILLVVLIRLGGDWDVRSVDMKLRRSLRLGDEDFLGGCFRFFQNCRLLWLDRARRRRECSWGFYVSLCHCAWSNGGCSGGGVCLRAITYITQKPLGRGGRVAMEIVCRLWNRPYETVRLPGSLAMILV